MPKLDAFRLTVREQVIETREFADSAQPGQALALTLLVEPGFCEDMAAHEIAGRLVEDFISGRNGVPPSPWPPPPHAPITITERACQICAMLEAWQRPMNPDDLYSAEELLVILDRMPEAYRQIAAWTVEIESRLRQRGNAAAAGRDGTSSSSPPAGTAALIPASITTSPTLCGVSTSSSPDGRD